MTENLKNFLEKVSESEELSAKVNKEADKAVIIAMAKEMGFTLTEADFEKLAEEELGDDDLDVVTGGITIRLYQESSLRLQTRTVGRPGSLNSPDTMRN